jgi:hypothetical protein
MNWARKLLQLAPKKWGVRRKQLQNVIYCLKEHYNFPAIFINVTSFEIGE